MYLPELNHITNYRYDLNGFGGINRRETADIGEFVKAINLSSDEYPLITPRKRYNVGEFETFALMWHNNDRDMALVPALKTEIIYKTTHIREVDRWVGNAPEGEFGIVYSGETEEEYEYVNEGLESIKLVPGKGYLVIKNGWDDVTMNMIGSITAVEGESYIRIGGGRDNIYIPEIAGLKNPVYANIGTSTVICDEINGMWVLEYDKKTDTYTYNKVHSKYTVKNDYNKVSGLDYISGGDICHMRVMFENGVPPTDIAYSIISNEYDSHEKWLDAYVSRASSYNKLVYYNESVDNPVWIQVLADGGYQIVDSLIYRFCVPNADKYFKVGDYINISNIKAYNVNPKSDIAESDNTVLSELEGYHEIINIEYTSDYGWGVDIKYKPLSKALGIAMFQNKDQLCKLKSGSTDLYEIDTLKNDLYLADGMTIERKAPENVRFICAHQNRIWANNGDNEIMCCARGNPYVWYRYEGNSLDSWATTIGGDGSFTGCINYGYPLFFKDNRMYRITGTRPANFGFDEYSMRGIKNGCHDSAVIVNDILYYQSIDGIYAYAESTPVCVSDKIYKGSWQRGKACRFGDKYYISVAEGEENKLYCYDTKSGLWHEESYNGLPVRYIYPGSYLSGYEEYMTVYVDGEDDNYIGFIISTADSYEHNKESPVAWSFETTDLLAGEIEHKYLKKLYINCRIYPEEYNEINIEVQYDGDGEWHHIKEITPTRGESRSIWYSYPMSNKRLDNFKIRVTSIGNAVIYGIVLEFEKGTK